LLGEKLGNLREEGYSMRRLWQSARADEIRRTIRRKGCYCTHECFMSTSILFNAWQLAACTSLAAKMALARGWSRLTVSR